MFLLLLYLDDRETVAQILSSSVLDSVNTTPAVQHLLSTAVLFRLFSLPCSYSFLLGFKEKVGRREKFNFPSFWPHSSISQPDRAPWYRERMFLSHNFCLIAVRFLIQICKHVGLQWSVPSGSAKEWLRNSTGGGRAIYLIRILLAASSPITCSQMIKLYQLSTCLYYNWLCLLFIIHSLSSVGLLCKRSGRPSPLVPTFPARLPVLDFI